MENTGKKNVIVRLSKDAGVVNTDGLHVYVVNEAGQLVETVGFHNSDAVLKTPQDLLGGNKLYIAQALPARKNGSINGKMNERTLAKMKAYEVVQNFDRNIIQIQRLPSIINTPFPFFNCLITGHVNKDFILDGQTQNLPICDLRVHICEVETELVWPFIPIYNRRIPDWVIQEIGQRFVNIAPRPTPPDPIGPVSLAKRNLPLRSLTAKTVPSLRKSSPEPLPDHVLSKMQSGSIDLIRQAMVDHHELLYPYFCYWPVYWPWIYTCDEETVVTTDCNGHFEMWENTFSEDGPLNIYIWIEAFIGGNWVTVYRPPLPCNTWWSYDCNTDINITLTDERLTPCFCGVTGPADAVWFRSIGSSASALSIEQNIGSTISIQSATLKNGGCTDIINGYKVSPFGSTLDLMLFVGDNIFASGATHYRWKTTWVANAIQNPVPGSPSIIRGTVYRPYKVQMEDGTLETHNCTLGSEGNGSDIAYRLPHFGPGAEPLSSLQDPADAGRWKEWSSTDFISASIDSNSLADGIYRFELELLVQAGPGFNLVPVSKSTFQVGTLNAMNNSEHAPDTYLNINTLDNTKADSYKMNVRIDNAHCVALINNVQLVETGDISGTCGFIHYGNNPEDTSRHADISFKATHPRDFATFSFGVVKGNGAQPTWINPSGYVLSGVYPFTLAAGTFSKDFTVSELLNGCPGQAAFSENLHVNALATNGSRQLYEYDWSDVKSFALSNT